MVLCTWQKTEGRLFTLGIIYIYWLMRGTLQSPKPNLQDTSAKQAEVLREKLTFWPSWYSLKDLWRNKSNLTFLAELHLWGSCIAMYVEKQRQEAMWLKVCSSKQFTKAATEGCWKSLHFGLLTDQWPVMCKKQKKKRSHYAFTTQNHWGYSVELKLGDLDSSPISAMESQ